MVKELAAEHEEVWVCSVDLVHQIHHHNGRSLLIKHTRRCDRPLQECKSICVLEYIMIIYGQGCF